MGWEGRGGLGVGMLQDTSHWGGWAADTGAGQSRQGVGFSGRIGSGDGMAGKLRWVGY